MTGPSSNGTKSNSLPILTVGSAVPSRAAADGRFWPVSLTCGRCGRRLTVSYSGRSPGQRVYRCDRPNLMLGQPRCMTFGGSRVEAALARELLRAVEPMAIEAALEAERMRMESQDERRRVVELELQQARYEASLAERRYAACDPDNRLIAAQLEKSWETALRRVEACRARLEKATRAPDPVADTPDFVGLADDLDAAWNAPNVTMRARQQLLRALIVDIIADVDEAAREVILTIHWRGGQHSQLRVRKPKSGEHGCRTPDKALAVIRSMADSMVRRAYRRVSEPDGHAHRPGQNLDGAPRPFVANGARDPCLSLGRKERRMADNERPAKLLGITTTQSAESSRTESSPPNRSSPTPRIRYAPATYKTKASSTRSRERLARVARKWKTSLQCFQILEKGGAQ